MHLEAKEPQECDFLITSLETYFGVLLEMEKIDEQTPNELEIISKELKEIADILQRINQYHEAYPETKGHFFYTKLSKNEVEHLIKSFEVFSSVKKENLSEQDRQLIHYYTEKANDFISNFSTAVYDEAFVRSLFEKYKTELKKYCDSAIAQHVKEGNKEVYVFAIQSFPGHYYQLVTMNTVNSLHAMSGENGFKEAAASGYNSELYNPACFDIESESPEQYDEAEGQISELYTQLFELTDEYSDSSYKVGSIEYEQMNALKNLADELFINISVETLKTIDFNSLNQSHIFCAIVSSYEFSEHEFYTYAKETIPKEKFDAIFPNANRSEEDYIDFTTSTSKETVTYLLNYIKDFRMNKIPEGRHYTEHKVYQYSENLADYAVLIDHELLLILEEIVEDSKPNPNNQEEKHFLCMFSKEGQLFSDLLQILSASETFAEGTQERLIEIYKKIIIGMIPSIQYPTVAHRDIAAAILSTDQKKYPQLEYDLETNYLKNINDYLT